MHGYRNMIRSTTRAIRRVIFIFRLCADNRPGAPQRSRRVRGEEHQE